MGAECGRGGGGVYRCRPALFRGVSRSPRPLAYKKLDTISDAAASAAVYPAFCRMLQPRHESCSNFNYAAGREKAAWGQQGGGVPKELYTGGNAGPRHKSTHGPEAAPLRELSAQHKQTSLLDFDMLTAPPLNHCTALLADYVCSTAFGLDKTIGECPSGFKARIQFPNVPVGCSKSSSKESDRRQRRRRRLNN
ncbi:hypothetical protein ACLKA6_008385 [Drosophila palustris]